MIAKKRKIEYNTYMKFVELKKRIKGGDIKPIYLLTGNDAYVIEKAYAILQSVVDSFPELNVTRFEDGCDLRAVDSALRSAPFLSSKRVVCLRDYKGSLDLLSDYFDKPNPDTVFVIIASSLSANLNRAVKSSELVDCDKLPENVLTAFIAKDVESRGCQITVPAAKLLISYCAGSLARIESETEKLCQISSLVTEEHVKANVNADVEYKIFELSGAITEKRGDRAMDVLKTLLSDGYAPSAILSMLQNHFRRLLYVALNKDDDSLASKLGVKEGAIYNATKQIKGFSPVVLKRIYDSLSNDEYMFKSGKTSDKEAMYSAVLRTLNV